MIIMRSKRSCTVATVNEPHFDMIYSNRTFTRNKRFIHLESCTYAFNEVQFTRLDLSILVCMEIIIMYDNTHMCN